MTGIANIVVIGSGFAGLWAALGAARQLDELAVPLGSISITVLSRKPFHDIRVRNYEADLNGCRIPLADVLDPAGVSHVVVDVSNIDTDARTVTTSTGTTHRYDRLVLAAGSHVVKPDISGLRDFGFDVDTYDGAAELERHLRPPPWASVPDFGHPCPASGSHRQKSLGRLGYGDVSPTGDRESVVGKRN